MSPQYDTSRGDHHVGLLARTAWAYPNGTLNSYLGITCISVRNLASSGAL